MLTITKRDLYSMFCSSPFGYIALIFFCFFIIGITLFLGGFLQANQANLVSMFAFAPWLLLLFIPAVAAGKISEEYNRGTVELLFTTPLRSCSFIIAKNITVFILSMLALLTTIPLWLTINYLGEPDNNLVIAGYVGLSLVCLLYGAISIWASSLTANFMLAFIISISQILLLLLLGSSFFVELLKPYIAIELMEVIKAFGILTHYNRFVDGFISTASLLYFAILIFGFMLLAMINVKNKIS